MTLALVLAPPIDHGAPLLGADPIDPDELAADAWAAYLAGTRHLRDQEYETLEPPAWRRLKGHLAMLERRRRLTASAWPDA